MAIRLTSTGVGGGSVDLSAYLPKTDPALSGHVTLNGQPVDSRKLFGSASWRNRGLPRDYPVIESTNGYGAKLGRQARYQNNTQPAAPYNNPFWTSLSGGYPILIAKPSDPRGKVTIAPGFNVTTGNGGTPVDSGHNMLAAGVPTARFTAQP